MSREIFNEGTPFEAADAVAYADGSVVSKTLVHRQAGTLTLFSFDEGQGLSEHTAPYDAVVHVLDGTAEVTVGCEKHRVGKGQMIVLPGGVPHAVHAPERFKMLLIMIRSEE